MKNKTRRSPTLAEAIISFILVMGAVIFALNFKAGMVTPLIIGGIVAAICALYLGNSWDEIQKSIVDGISNGTIANLILMLSGMIVGVWILGGTVPTLIYYGLKSISPSIFLPLTFILSCATSLATGTSFGTVATVGLALSGVGIGLGVPAPMTVGAIVSGAFFGDKMSPISDTTNIAPAMAGSDLFEHIGSMLWTTVPATILSIIIYSILGLNYGSGNVDFATISDIIVQLESNFNISVLTIVPPILLLVLSIKKVPAVATLSIVSVFSFVWAMITQGASFAQVLSVSMSGFTSETGLVIVDKILSRGGVSMMMSTVAMVIAATAMGGILEKSEILKVLIDAMINKVKTYTGLIISTLISCYAVVGATGNMMIGIILPGRTFKPAYEKMDVHPKVLSRSLEDVSTLSNAIIPWGGACLFIQGVLGIDISFIPYAFLNYLVPIFSVILAITGIGVWNRAGEPVRKAKKTEKAV